jgi:Uma2 family endonuclease
MAEPTRKPTRTPAEWLAWEEQQLERYELLWDEPTLMAGVTLNHSRITLNILTYLRSRLRGGPCRVDADVKVGLSDGRWLYPDAFVHCTPRGGRETLVDDPVVVVEVLSSGTLIYNTNDKRWDYQEIPSLRHLVIVAPDRPKVEVATRGGDGTWRSVFHVDLDAEARLDALDLALPLAVVYDEVDFSRAASAQSETASDASTTPAKA